VRTDLEPVKGVPARRDPCADQDLLSALAGKQAARDCLAAHRARRVVRSSAGVILDQEAARRRGSSMAAAAVIVFVLLLPAPVWWAANTLLSEEHKEALSGQLSMLIFIFSGALLGAILLAGWVRRRP